MDLTIARTGAAALRRRDGAIAIALVVLAAFNVCGGVLLTLARDQVADLFLVASWLQTWLSGGHLYGPGSITDYPPWAIVTLSPLALVPLDWLPAAWIVFNLGLAAVIVWRLATISHENASRVRNLALLLAATGTIRQLLQFSHLSYALAIVGAFTASPLIGGLLVGVSLMKPQIGGVVWLWLVLRRDWRRATYALTAPLILTAVYIAVAPIGLLDLISGYYAAITSQYSNPTQLPGQSDLRLWLWQLWPEPSGNALLSGLVLAGLLVPLVTAVVRQRADGRDMELLGLCGAVSLLAVRHLSYDFLLLLPVLVAWRCPPCARAPQAPRWMFFGLAVLLVAAVPSWAKLALAYSAPPATSLLLELDRVMCIGVWAALSWRLNQRRLADDPARNGTTATLMGGAGVGQRDHRAESSKGPRPGGLWLTDERRNQLVEMLSIVQRSAIRRRAIVQDTCRRRRVGSPEFNTSLIDPSHEASARSAAVSRVWHRSNDRCWYRSAENERARASTSAPGQIAVTDAASSVLNARR